MSDLNFNAIIEDLEVTSRLYEDHVLIVRHATVAHGFITRDVEAFEEYQRFQSADNFGRCDYVISFVGLPGKDKDATFAGIYRVTARYKRGDPDFRSPKGDPEVVAACAGLNFLYGLSRETRFDFLQYAWDIRWNASQIAWRQYLKPDSSFQVIRFPEADDSSQARAVIDRKNSETNLADEILENSAGYSEGAQYYGRHVYRERNHELVRLVKEAAKKAKRYHCEICLFDFQLRYGIDYLECHHTIPVSTLPPGSKTRPEDVALLCANCHRAIHKRTPWLHRNELHKLLEPAQPTQLHP